jgi:type IV pilus assembly protein PilN
MGDIRVNLLPWREQLREEKKQEFLNVLVGVLVFAGVIVFAVDRFYNSSIDNQNARNNFIKSEISVLEDKIAEIKLLQQKRAELLARMKVIQELQGNRPIIVRIFDEMARQLSDRVFFTTLTYSGNKMNIRGVAESNNRISSQLRNFDESEWFTGPNVTEIDADPNFGPQASQFSLTVEQTTPPASKEDEG